ncbi:hypothetical protein ACOSQ2_021231 [Xanthoceras sorbifolium]
MHPLKAYARNKAHPEGSIAEDQENQIKHLSVFKPTVRLLGAAIHDELTLSDLAKIRWHVLNNCDEVYRYITFNEDLKILSNGPAKLVTNTRDGIRFHKQDRDCNRRTQNCGVLVKGEHGGKSIDFYGVLKDIIEWDLSGRKGIQIDEHNIIMFYLNDIKLRDDWSVVDKSQPRGNYDNIDDDTLCRNDMDMIDVDVNVENQNDAIDNFMDDDSVTDDAGFN